MIYKEGDILSVLITVANNGSLVATNSVATITIPSGLTYSSDTPTQGTYAAGTWSIGELIQGQSESLTLELEVTAVCSFPATVSWSVTADQADPDLTNNAGSYIFSEDSCCEVRECSQSFYKEVWVDTVNAPSGVGTLEKRELPYTTLTNALTDVKADASPTNWTIYFSGTTSTETLTDIPAGTTIVFNNAAVTDLTLSTGNTMYIKGELRSSGTNLIISAGMDGKVVLNNALLITNGVAVPISDTAISVTNINSTTNSITGFANVTFVHQALNVIPSLV